MLEGTAIVVSPLLALMDDQIQSLTKRGINATTLNSTLGIKAKRKVFEELKTGNVKLLYIAPETILNKEISSFIQDFVNISFIAIDEVHCFKSSTKVETDLGAFTFKELFNLQSNNINLPKAKSFNIEKNIFEYKQIKEIFQNPFSQLQRTWVEGGKIDSTPNHVFFTSEGEKMAKDLKSGDKLISFNKGKKYTSLNKNRLQFVLGSLLGDGGISCLDSVKHIHRLHYTHCEAQKEYLEWKYNFIGRAGIKYIPENGYSKKPAYTFNSFSFELPYNLYPVKRGTKRPILSEEILNQIEEKALAVWFMDDGSCSKHNNYTLHCNSFSEALVEQFILLFQQKYNILAKHKKNKEYSYLYFNVNESEKFAKLISKYIHPTMRYKLGRFVFDDFKNWIDTQDLPQVSLVKKTKLLRTIKPDNFLYDMEVEDNHNYFVYTENTNNSLKNKYQNNTLLVHNCLSQWGTGFRPKYAQLYELRKLFPNKCIAGFTATADLVTRNDIINVLQFKNYTEYTHDLDRSSIKYIVYEKRDENLQTLNIIKKYPEDTCGIIYVGTRDKASALQSYLNNRNINCEFFHAGLKVAEKKQIQEDYINGNLNLIICTVAFGMGIDRSNVRYVINVDLPNSLEEFSQMSGRAARDGLESESYLLYGQQDIAKATWLIRQSVKNPDRLKINLDKLKLVVGYAQTNMCRRKKLLEYFGQKIDNCGYCDNCHKNGVYRK